MIPTQQQLTDAAERIRPYIHRTPVLSSESINQITGASIYFKCENFQKMGAFKMRGAANAILNLSQEEQKKGITTHSSGNFAQAVSLSAKSLGVNAYIVMPSNAPSVKKAAVLGYGASVIDSEPTLAARESETAKVMEKTGATFVHPSNDVDVILGQGTAALELLEDYPDLDYVLAPIGGGGLVAGTALATHYFSKAKTIGAEPMGADDAYRSLQEGMILPMLNPNTIADGLRTSLGHHNFPIIQKLVDKIIRVEEDMIVKAMRLVWERMKIVIEPSSAVALAAVLTEPDFFDGKQVGIIISGGNVDLSNLPF
jgi:threonine dehydratase